jgi:UDP-N-acetylglucosamine 2-epimerase (non-hydrolysing)
MRVAIAVGTRPEIVKMAPIIRACQAAEIPFFVVHTGQHYSYQLDGIFFEELELPMPEVRLDVGSGSHGYQISTIMARLEPILRSEEPDIVLVEGDTNSVVGVALVAKTLNIPLAHIEAGLRSYDRSMPEEMNRVLVDHISDILFAPTKTAAAALIREGISHERVAVSGNTVVDELLRQRERADRLGTADLLGLAGQRYALATVHRAENTDDPDRLRGIFEGLGRIGRELRLPVVAALHPRTMARLEQFSIPVEPGIRVLPPLGYLEFLGLHATASLVVTDSGGLQEEACTLGVPVVTIRDSTERPESIEVGANVLAGADPERILGMAAMMLSRAPNWLNPFGDGKSGARIVGMLGAAIESHKNLVSEVITPWPSMESLGTDMDLVRSD